VDRVGRTDPAKKDLFIYSDAPGQTDGGVDLFGRTTLIKVRKINSNEADKTQCINFNSIWAYNFDERAVFIHVGTQKEIDDAWGQGGSFEHPGGLTLQRQKKLFLLKSTDQGTICHELGHTVWIEYHGDGDYDLSLKDWTGDICGKKTAARTKLLGQAEKMGKKLEDVFIAVMHGEHSGEPACFMHYRWADFIETAAGRRRIPPESHL